MNKNIWVGCDHGGYDLKLHVLAHLHSKGLLATDVGCHSEEIVRYPYYAAQVVEAIVSGKTDRGILICSTGIGMSIIANKYRGIRASVCTSTYMGRMTRQHNDSNVLCLGGRITGTLEAIDILDAWLVTPFEGQRHSISLHLISDAEAALSQNSFWNPPDPMLKDQQE